jgi:hypothetical protein
MHDPDHDLEDGSRWDSEIERTLREALWAIEGTPEPFTGLDEEQERA